MNQADPDFFCQFSINMNLMPEIIHDPHSGRIFISDSQTGKSRQFKPDFSSRKWQYSATLSIRFLYVYYIDIQRILLFYS